MEGVYLSTVDTEIDDAVFWLLEPPGLTSLAILVHSVFMTLCVSVLIKGEHAHEAR